MLKYYVIHQTATTYAVYDTAGKCWVDCEDYAIPFDTFRDATDFARTVEGSEITIVETE